MSCDCLKKVFEQLDLNYLDLSGSYIGQLNATTFKRGSRINSLKLRRTNLSISDVKPFENQLALHDIDISGNNLIQLNFSTSAKFYYLKEIILDDNHLTELNGLTSVAYPKLEKLYITNNQFNCTYIEMFKKGWTNLEITGSPCDDLPRSNDIEIQTQTAVSTEIQL